MVWCVQSGERVTTSLLTVWCRPTLWLRASACLWYVCLSLSTGHCMLAVVNPECVSVDIDVCVQIEQCQKIKAQEVKVAVDPCE